MRAKMIAAIVDITTAVVSPAAARITKALWNAATVIRITEAAASVGYTGAPTAVIRRIRITASEIGIKEHMITPFLMPKG